MFLKFINLQRWNIFGRYQYGVKYWRSSKSIHYGRKDRDSWESTGKKKIVRYYLRNQLFGKRSMYIRIKFPFISNLKKTACASKQDVLELATLWYTIGNFARKPLISNQIWTKINKSFISRQFINVIIRNHTKQTLWISFEQLWCMGVVNT